jgi:hypothetical protein
MFHLGNHSKQAGKERDLTPDVSFFDATYLSFPDHIHHLVPLYGEPCGLK